MPKAQSFCAYRERCVSEVEQKLGEWGLKQADIDHVVDELVESDFINEKRFASSYARGKFINNKWGRQKIQISMKKMNLKPEDIETALKKIDANEYEKTAFKLIEKKWLELDSNEDRIKRSKIYYYMVNKGFESDVVFNTISKVDKKSSSKKLT